jgi:histidyl-tRNA synthetase
MPKDKGDKSAYQLKVPKGTKDWDGKDMIIRNKIFDTITDVFKKYGAVTIDTPVFELKEILAGKYGEDSKLIYDLADQGGELCSLRYDLTVPFARWLAMNGNVKEIKRYHIAKVYRRDQPAMTKGRMREFYQCDFDIAGTYDAMLPDSEVLGMAVEIFDKLGWQGKFTIKLNHRKILDGIFQVCGVPEEKIRTISSAVDKLDKSPWSEVRREMTEEKGLAEGVANRIGEYVVLKGGSDLLERLKKDEKLSANESAKAGLADIERLFRYLTYNKALDRISFDMSLARGLDYYTGVIYEVVTEGSAPQTAEGQALQQAGKKESKPKKHASNVDGDEDRSNDPSVGVGSIAAGGRYDNLVSMFSGKQQIPCVGISFGIERIFSITKQRLAADSSASQVRTNETDVFIMAVGGSGLLEERMRTAQRLRDAGIKTEYSLKEKPRFDKQFKDVDRNGTPFSVILGEDELNQGKCKVKRNGLPENHPEKEGVVVQLADLETEVKARVAQFYEEQESAGSSSGVESGVNGLSLEEQVRNAPKTG